ncbi:MAG: MarR family winged helix-turn-helix transcriptional regulator [Mycobacterium sp.]
MADGAGFRENDLGVLSSRLLHAFQTELFQRLREQGFDDIVPRHGGVLAHLRPEGVRATDLARRSGQLKQVVGVIVDELESLKYVERRPDPVDRRAKLVVPTRRGRAQMRAATSIIADIMSRHEGALGADEFARFMATFKAVVDRQRAVTADDAAEQDLIR